MHSNSPDKTQSCVSPTQPGLQPENEGDASGLQISTWLKHMCWHVDHTNCVCARANRACFKGDGAGSRTGGWLMGTSYPGVLVPATVVVDDAPIMDVPRPEVYGASGLSQGCGVLSRSWGDRDAGIWVLLQGS